MNHAGAHSGAQEPGVNDVISNRPRMERGFRGSVIALSMGDPNGIGPEIILKSLKDLPPAAWLPQGGTDSSTKSDASHRASDADSLSGMDIVIYGSEKVFEREAVRTGFDPSKWQRVDYESDIINAGLHLIDVSDGMFDEPASGKVDSKAGDLSMKAVERAAIACLEGRCDGLVTAPISKEAIHLAGYDVPGHTEFLARICGVRHVGMMMVHENLRIGLQSIHIPLSSVARELSVDRLIETLRLFSRTLSEGFGITDPTISVLGVNPHAGDGGVIGREEQDIIMPAIKRFNTEGGQASGPFPADAFFARTSWKRSDLTLAMYHDQGLIPFKMLDEGRGVNLTAGLPFVRTSPDHGTAFDIAGQGVADHSSFSAALDLCLKLTNRKDRNAS